MMAMSPIRPNGRRGAARGFTLPELLISMAILSILTLALFMLFRSTLSAYKSTKKAMDASEESHTAFRVLERDLVQGYAAKHYGDSANFFGCPFGMTMICTMDAAGQYRTARVSYVVHSFAGSGEVPAYRDDPNDDLEVLVPTQAMIRYIEPGVDSLNEYPLAWPDYTDPTAPIEETQQNLYQPLRVIYELFGPEGPSPVGAAQLEAMLQSKKHELWLAMLGDRLEPFGELPRLWDDPAAPGTTWGGGPNFAARWDGKYPEDYLIAEGILQTAPGPIGTDLTQTQWFLYGYTPRDPRFIEDVGAVEMIPYWNAADSDNIGIPGETNYPFVNYYGSPLYPFPPSLVATNMDLVFKAPNLGEHHYVRRLSHTFQIPVGYRRPVLE